MKVCPYCGKQNQDHYRFCLGCGAELPPPGAAPSAPAGGHGIVDEETVGGTGAPVAAPAEPAPPPEPPPGTCPECSTVNPPTNRFCASCGCKLEKKAAAAPPPKARTVVPSEPTSGFVLVALDAEGNDIGRFELPRGETVLGRATGGVFGNDAFLSPKHARLVAKDGRLTVSDAGSLNGIYRKLLAEQRAPLAPGQFFRIGQELLVFETLEAKPADADGVTLLGGTSDGVVGRVSLVVGRASRSPSVAVPAHGLHLGRERGDVTFSDDGYVSGLHCKVSAEEGQMYVTDLGSSNGTFVQLLGEVELKADELLLMGQQLFRVST
ncbi:MAG: FHA domain-containing protein [Deltaproteobacteria bacterium]|nr:FHA domain-containing protein [Deltaproteobacteria bacterium]